MDGMPLMPKQELQAWLASLPDDARVTADTDYCREEYIGKPITLFAWVPSKVHDGYGRIPSDEEIGTTQSFDVPT